VTFPECEIVADCAQRLKNLEALYLEGGPANLSDGGWLALLRDVNRCIGLLASLPLQAEDENFLATVYQLRPAPPAV
jgi:hypothetical protein